MTNVTAVLVKELRERTGVGMMECKKALVEAQGDIELAINNMRKFGQAKAAKKANRIAAEGIILTKIAQNSKYGVIIELNCETDFVAKDNAFKVFGDTIITAALDECITNLDILKGKFEEQRTDLVAKLGENINIRRLGMLEGNLLGHYIHGTRIGVIISATGKDKDLLKHLAMHIAASKPEYVNKCDIPADIITRERQIQFDIAIQSGKSHEIAEKVVEGRIRKFTEEISLTEQHFIMDQSKTVNQLLIEHGVTVNNFIRFELGEGIEKTAFNFTAEVAKMGKNFSFHSIA